MIRDSISWSFSERMPFGARHLLQSDGTCLGALYESTAYFWR